VPEDTALSAYPLGILLFLVGAVAVVLFGVVLNFVYYAWFESSKTGATPGKKLMRIRVVNTNGERITFLRALLRRVGKTVSGLVLYLGFLMILFTERRQALHDVIAGTLVVCREDTIEPMT
jgi:uncharacterized RDD family membrane protein YckC